MKGGWARSGTGGVFSEMFGVFEEARWRR